MQQPAQRGPKALGRWSSLPRDYPWFRPARPTDKQSLRGTPNSRQAGLFGFATPPQAERAISTVDLELLTVLNRPDELIIGVFAFRQRRGLEPSAQEREIMLEP
jgi:hypothetical protein